MWLMGLRMGANAAQLIWLCPFLQPPSSVEGTSGWNACKKYGYIKQANENYVHAAGRKGK